MATTQNPTKPISSFFGSPRFFNGFFIAKTLLDQESSPTSVLDTKQLFPNFGSNPFGFKQNPVKPRKIFQEIKNPFEKSELQNGIALALALVQEKPNDNTILKPNAITRKVLFINGSSEDRSDFGIRTRNMKFMGHPSPTGSGSCGASIDALSLREMELTEEYTRVISYGPNPKTTHIYDNCVLNGCSEDLYSDPDPKSPWQSFLSFCHTCNKNLEDDCDIFMYRGEKAFCSEECRCQEMILDGLVNS